MTIMKTTQTGFSCGRQLRMILQYHEVFGQWYIPNQRAYVPHERGYYVVNTNRQGMRSSIDYSLNKPTKCRRILVFGDSFTAGEAVNNEERYTDLLEKMQSELEVLNFGLPGSGTDQQLLIYENLGRPFEADILLLCPLVENINRIAKRFRPAIEGRTGEIVLVAKPYFTLEKGQGLTLQHVPVPRIRVRPSQASKEILANTDLSGQFPKLRDFLNRYLFPVKNLLIRFFGYNPYPQYSAENPDWKIMKTILQRFVDEANGLKVVIAPLPTYHYIEKLSQPVYWECFKKFGEENPDIQVINVLPYFHKLDPLQRRRCRYKRDIHYTPLAHLVVAKALKNELQSRQLI